MGGKFKAVLRIHVDTHTLNRLEALKVLRHDSDPGAPFHRDEILREALVLGLDLMLGEGLLRDVHASGSRVRTLEMGHSVGH